MRPLHGHCSFCHGVTEGGKMWHAVDCEWQPRSYRRLFSDDFDDAFDIYDTF